MKKAIGIVGLVLLLLTRAVSAQSRNTSYGAGALANNTTGSGNSAFGYFAMFENTTGSGNTAYGLFALCHNTTSNANTATGASALYANTTGYCNTAHGSYAMYLNTTGYCNTATGDIALSQNTIGYHNTATGHAALTNNTAGYRNTATGGLALYHCTTGDYNTATGAYALFYSTTACCNTATGYAALTKTTGSYNTATGYDALCANTTGYSNTTHGSYALYSNTTGCRNTGTGSSALYYNTTGNYNTAHGNYALYYNTTGTCNTAIGYFAGPNTCYPDLTNSTALGYNTMVFASNQVRIGNALVTSIGGQVGWTTVSDARFKQDVKQDVLGLAFIKKLRPVSYKIDEQAFNAFVEANSSDELTVASSQMSEYTTGFIAQEVEALVQECGFGRFSGVDAPKNNRDYYGIRYSEFVVPLVKAVQELSDIVEKQQQQIEEQQKQINMLMGKKAIEQRSEALEPERHEIEKAPGLPKEFALEQSYPNPFSKATSIKFALPKASNVELVVYNMLGQKVSTLISGQMAAGYHSITWDASDVSAGTYFYRLQAGNFISNKKVLVLK
jgi:uncharacterized coiled-coil protein SlyX